MISRRGVLAGSAALSAASATAAADRRSAGVLTAADSQRAGYPTVKAVEWIGEELERETGGRCRIRHYASGQLGTEDDSLGLARYGALDLTRVAMAAVNNSAPLTRVMALPFVFRSVEHLRRAVDGPVGRRVLDGFAPRGLVGLAIYDAGARCFYNVRRPVHEVADLKGLKIRVPQSDVFLQAAAAMGANATPLPFGATFSALQTHLIDGAENNAVAYESTRHFEVAPHWAETRHSYSPDVLLMSKRKLDAMAPRDRDLLRDLARRSVARMRVDWDGAEAEARAKAAKGGVKSTAVDRVTFERAAEPVIRRHLRTAEAAALHRAIRDLA